MVKRKETREEKKEVMKSGNFWWNNFSSSHVGFDEWPPKYILEVFEYRRVEVFIGIFFDFLNPIMLRFTRMRRGGGKNYFPISCDTFNKTVRLLMESLFFILREDGSIY
ncbi:hypothetical protein CEXT_476051 [Caerostris extrusa]|uniref:Uncharacterized protein n=1 Tax=Caerostris extrusa TaxID=172846 RepID=A0AAV4U1N0_CAEEX|nr:hypothetical protein CEXT_476051 [Caerostris extrusa]